MSRNGRSHDTAALSSPHPGVRGRLIDIHRFYLRGSLAQVRRPGGSVAKNSWSAAPTPHPLPSAKGRINYSTLQLNCTWLCSAFGRAVLHVNFHLCPTSVSPLYPVAAALEARRNKALVLQLGILGIYFIMIPSTDAKSRLNTVYCRIQATMIHTACNLYVGYMYVPLCIKIAL